MKRIRLIGLAVIVVCGTSVIAPASASAQAYEFKAAAYPVEWKGTATNTHAFNGGGAVIACPEATFNTNEELGEDPEAEAVNPTRNAPSLVTHPIYSNCKGTVVAGTFPVELRSKYCNYRMHAVPPGVKTGVVDVVCERIALLCEVTEKSPNIKCPPSAKLHEGMTVTGRKIPPGTEVRNCNAQHECEISTLPEGTGTATVKETLAFKVKGIELVFLGLPRCAITIFPQTLSGIGYKNEPKAGAAEQELTTEVEVAEIKSKATSACGIGEAEFKSEYREGKIETVGGIETASIEPPGHPATIVFKGFAEATKAQEAIEVGVAAPRVTNVEPPSGPAAGGTSVTIIGTNLGGATSVTFGSTPATSFTVNSESSITAVSPAGTGTVDVTVTTQGGTSATSSADRFTYGPTVTTVEPNHGSPSGGTTVMITGTGFTGATAVKFGSTSAASFTVNSPTSITAASPKARGAETIDVTVTSPAGTSPTSAADQFTYSRN